jgi:hypothetical protein
MRRVDVDRVGVAAYARFALVNRHAMVAREKPGSRHPGNARADYCEVRPALDG